MFNNFLSVFGNTLSQAALSSLLVLFFGFIGAIGIVSIKNKRLKKIVNSISLYSTMVPAIFLTLALLNVFKFYPFGFWGIVFAHVLSMVPFSALILSRLIEEKIPNLERLCYLEGASLLLFLQSAIGYLKKDIFSVFFYCLIIFTSSFSIPLILGHGFMVSETYVNDLIKVQGRTDLAIIYCLMQIAAIFFLSRFVRINLLIKKNTKGESYLFKQKYFSLIAVLPVFLILFGIFSGFGSALTQISNLDLSFYTIADIVFNSLIVGYGTALLLILLFSALSYFHFKHNLMRFFYSFTMPSTALIGVLFWFLFSRENFLFFQLILGLILVHFTALFRLEVFDKLQSLSGQVRVAELMGAGRFEIYKTVALPQVMPSIVFVSALGGFWAVGDFAFSQMILGNDSTLSLFIYSLMSQYRMELASLLIMVLFFVGLFVFFTIQGLKNVCR